MNCIGERVAGLPVEHDRELIIALFGGHAHPSHYYCDITQSFLILTPSKSKKFIRHIPSIRRKSRVHSPYHRDSLTTAASPRTATVVDAALKIASQIREESSTCESVIERQWPSATALQIALVDIVAISITNFVVSKTEALERDEPAYADRLARYQFIDSTLEADAVLFRLNIDARPHVEFVAYERDSRLAEELSAARLVALARHAMGIGPSCLAEPESSCCHINVERSDLHLQQTLTIPPMKAEETNVASVIQSFEDSLRLRSIDFSTIKRDDKAGQFRTKSALSRQQDEETRFLDECQKIMRYFHNLERQALTDITLKRAIFSSSLILTTILTWLDHLDRDMLQAIRSNQGSHLQCGCEDTSLLLPKVAHVRRIQVCLAQRALAGLRLLCASLHDRRGIAECFEIFCLPGWPIDRIVRVLSADHFNYSEQRICLDASNLSLSHASATFQRESDTWKVNDRNSCINGQAKDVHKCQKHTISIESSSLGQSHWIEQRVPAANKKTRSAETCCEITARHIIRTGFSSSVRFDGSRPTLQDNAMISGEKNRAKYTYWPQSPKASALFLAAANEENLRLEKKYQRNRGESHQMLLATTESSCGKRPTTEAISAAKSEFTCGHGGSKYTDKAFVKDPWSPVAFADVRRPKSDLQNDSKVFSELLDAQVSTLQRLDELTGAWCREPHRVKSLHGHEIDRGIIPRLISRDTDQTSTLIQVLFERCIAIILKLSNQEAGLQMVNFPKHHDIMFEPIALLSNAQFLLALLKCSHRNREIAAMNCSDELSDFLVYESFYHRLAEHRVADVAGQLVKEAVTLAMHAQHQPWCGSN